MDARAIDRALTRIAHEIVEVNHGVENLAILGIQRRGVQLAERIVAEIERSEGSRPDIGVIDITLYRDDLESISDQAVVQETDIPFDVEGKVIVLVDDVLYTGRTVRAQRDHDSAVEADQPPVLVDRGHQEIPIRARTSSGRTSRRRPSRSRSRWRTWTEPGRSVIGRSAAKNDHRHLHLLGLAGLEAKVGDLLDQADSFTGGSRYAKRRATRSRPLS
jgi:pyrimidine operon attenuation protein/uracil phosphoribosyltransferase